MLTIKSQDTATASVLREFYSMEPGEKLKPMIPTEKGYWLSTDRKLWVYYHYVTIDEAQGIITAARDLVKSLNEEQAMSLKSESMSHDEHANTLGLFMDLAQEIQDNLQ